MCYNVDDVMHSSPISSADDTRGLGAGFKSKRAEDSKIVESDIFFLKTITQTSAGDEWLNTQNIWKCHFVNTFIWYISISCIYPCFDLLSCHIWYSLSGFCIS